MRPRQNLNFDAEENLAGRNYFLFAARSQYMYCPLYMIKSQDTKRFVASGGCHLFGKQEVLTTEWWEEKWPLPVVESASDSQ